MLLKSFLLLLVLLSSFFFSSSREIFETLVKECVLRNLLFLLEPQNASFTPRSRDDHFPKDETMGEGDTEEERNDMMSVSLFSKALIFICSF
jgi:hypothetical protein